jgi:TRAP-type C4-dicarboxylate transport system permease small subunit
MRYPKFWKKTVDALGLASGFLTMVIAIMSLGEAISRYVFKHPTSWSLTLSTYILIYIVFFASPYAFQEGGHVAVDMVKIACDKISASGRLRKIISVIGYIFAVVFIVVIFKGSLKLFNTALAMSKMTVSNPVIPMWILYLPMLIGSVLMIITLVFMILDCLAKDGTGKYL